MKKHLCMLVALMLMMPLGANAVVVAGDMNGDNRIDIVDVTSLIDYLLNKKIDNVAAADANGDGQVDVTDVTDLIDLILSNDQIFVVNGVTFSMIPVEGGTFLMGATPEQGNDALPQESPVHEVTLSTYSIGQTEVTQALWEAVMGTNPSGLPHNSYAPVDSVSWSDCQAFIYKLNQLTGMNFRLPTEAEWEFAARGGNMSKGYKYAGSDTLDDVAWYYGNIPSDLSGPERYAPHIVAQKAPNELGIYDMSGNVFEWCLDGNYSYTSEAQTNPATPASGTGSYLKIKHMSRGGACSKDANGCRVSCRQSFNDVHPWNYYGLRLALDPDDSPKFRLSESVVKVWVGNTVSVNILNGSGNYSVTGGMGLFSTCIVGNTLNIRGLVVGVSSAKITDNVTGATAVLNVITCGDETFNVNGVSFKMVYVEGGTFSMGRMVTLSGYYMGETEVTQALWLAVMGSNPSYFTGDMNLPVETVTWDEQVEFVTRLKEMTGRNFRIPTEAEWQFAALGGNYSQGYIYAGSANPDDVAWYDQNSGTDYPTHPVKMKLPNELGLYDMSGNVWERVSDWYAPYGSQPETNPTGPETGTYRINRGGSVAKPANQSTVYFRGYQNPTYKGRYDGLRLAMSSPL